MNWGCWMKAGPKIWTPAQWGKRQAEGKDDDQSHKWCQTGKLRK